MTIRSSSLRLADHLSANPYSWPGGYPMFGLFSDGGACCPRCAKSERASIGTTTGTDGWRLVVIAINWEDQDLYCSNCNNRIESAYAEAEQ